MALLESPRKKRRWPRLLWRAFALLVAVLVAGTWASTDGFAAFGGAASAARAERAERSPHFKDGKFQNPEPTGVMSAKDGAPVTWQWLTGNEMRAPRCPLPLFPDPAAKLAVPPASGLRITWLGHSTTLIEVDGVTVLTDPMFSERAFASTWVGPKRFHPPPLALDALPKLDAVIISHEHYDHLDMRSVQALAKRGVVFHVPLGVGAHLDAWGVKPEQIVELDWWESVKLPNGVELTATQARHFNGRGFPGRRGSSWTSWSLVGPVHRVFFSGDTGMTDSFDEIGKRFGPFDVALLEVGQSNPAWGDIHLGPQGAIDAVPRLQAKALFPIHWGTFELALHPWSEPAETATVLAQQRGIRIVTPMLGEPAEPTVGTTGPWWRAFPPTAARCPTVPGR